MRNTPVTRILLASLLVTLVTAGAATAGNNDGAQQSKELKKMGGDFAVAGTFTGKLEGHITVGGQKILITKKTTIFEAGSGPVKRRARVMDTPVYITGSMRRGVLVASVVVIADRKNSGRSTPLTNEFTKPKNKKVAH